MLLSAACFLRSSNRLYGWITSHRRLGPYVRNYLKHRAVTVQSKIAGIALLWGVILTSALVFADALWIRLILLVVAIGVTIHLVSMKTLTKEMLSEEEEESKHGV